MTKIARLLNPIVQYFADEYEGKHYVCQRYANGEYDVYGERPTAVSAQEGASELNRKYFEEVEVL